MIISMKKLGIYGNVVDFAINFGLEKEYRVLTGNEDTDDLYDTIGESGTDEELMEELLNNIPNRWFHIEMDDNDDFVIYEVDKNV